MRNLFVNKILLAYTNKNHTLGKKLFRFVGFIKINFLLAFFVNPLPPFIGDYADKCEAKNRISLKKLQIKYIFNTVFYYRER